jgi:hypothetical protein
MIPSYLKGLLELDSFIHFVLPRIQLARRIIHPYLTLPLFLHVSPLQNQNKDGSKDK